GLLCESAQGFYCRRESCMSIKHLIEGLRVVLRRGCYARDQEVGNVQTITRGGDATGAGSPEGESLLSRQAGVEPNYGGRCAGPDLRAGGGRRFRRLP